MLNMIDPVSYTHLDVYKRQDYILPNLLLSKDQNRTLAVGLYALISEQESTGFTMFAAGAVLVAVPISIVYIIFQKYIVQGISAGANKE